MSPAEGKVFDYWHVSDDTVAVENPYSPTTTFIMPDSYVTIVARFKDKAEGTFTVSGTATRFGSQTDDMTIQLIKSGESEAAYEAIVKGDATGYSIAGVLPGTYTMKVMKQNHVTREYTVTVESSNVTQNVKICLLGDVNMDGTISVIDATEGQKDIVNLISLNDYQNRLADVNNDGIVSIVDVTLIQKYIAGLIDKF